MTTLSKTAYFHITDKTGNKFFKTSCGDAYKSSVVRDLQRHLDAAKKYPEQYKFIDIETAKIEEVA